MRNLGGIDFEVSCNISFAFFFPHACTRIWELFPDNEISDASTDRKGFMQLSTLVDNAQCVQLGWTDHHIFLRITAESFSFDLVLAVVSPLVEGIDVV